MHDLRQSPEYANYLRDLGWLVEKKGSTNFYIRRLPIIGGVLKIQRPARVDFSLINELSKKYRVFQIVIEPLVKRDVEPLIINGYKLSRNYFAPSKTLQVDLSKTEGLLLTNMHYKTRYNLKKARDNGLKVKVSRKINEFADFWQQCASKQRGMYLSQKKEIAALYSAFGANAFILTVSKGLEILSGVLMVSNASSAHYMYAAATPKGRGLFAPTLNAWSAIKLAKSKGNKVFDFEGVFDERFPVKSWLGFTRFKKSFGGKEVKYPGCYNKFRLPI